MTKPTTKATLTDAEQSALNKLPLHTPQEIASYARPGEGIERITPLVTKALAKHPAIATALKIDPEQLSRTAGDAAELNRLEASTHMLYRRAMENRLELESDLYRALLKLNRFVANADDRELEVEFAALAEWVASATAHASPAPAKTSDPTKA